MGLTFYERYWQREAGDPMRHWQAIKPVLASVVPKNGAPVVVDLGCGKGDGIHCARAVNSGARCVGLDVSGAALEMTHQRFPEIELHRITDGGPLPLASASADLVICVEVIEHVYDTEATFSEIARVLRPGGKLLLSTPYHGRIKNLLIALLAFDRHFAPTGPHVRFFSRRSLGRCLQNVGLQTTAIRYLNRFWPIWEGMLVTAERQAIAR